ncbi:MAG: copper chaperone PCu(A)C [Gammaproteobacteria bacterium]|nr:copper chaperone PCu(A)C [Gammaproteobacteria bacterium]
MKKLLVLILLIPLMAQAEFLSVEKAWIRAAPPNARVMVAYATINNISEYTIWLTGASSSHFKAVEMHETIEENGMASMIHVDFIQLAPGESVNFGPGGKHFMLFTPLASSSVGDSIELKLHLGNGDRESFSAKVSRKQP